MTAREDLHRLVDLLTDADAEDAIEYLRWLTSPTDTLSTEELVAMTAGEAQLARDGYVTLTELSAALDE